MAKQHKNKTNMSNFDLSIIAKELNDLLSGGFIDNIYEISDSLLQIKCRTKTGKVNMILDASKRINITNYSYPIPSFPSQYCSVLRKYMRGRRIISVYQHNFDRILVFVISNKDGDPWKFIVEMFLGGNFLLIDHNELIFMAKHYKIVKNRKILAKKEYIFPDKRGENFWSISKKKLIEIIKTSDIDLVRTLVRNLNLVGYLAEEVCTNSNVDKKKKSKDLTMVEIEKIEKEIGKITKIFQENMFSFRIYFDVEEQYVSFEPFKMSRYTNLNFKEFSTYNETLDDYYAKIDSNQLLSSELTEAVKNLSKYERIHAAQTQQIEKSKIERETHLELGDLIYENFDVIELLLTNIFDALKKGMKWEEIAHRLKLGKEKGIKEAMIFDRIYPNESKISVVLDGKKIKMDVRKSVVNNAKDYYDKAKKDKRRIQGAKEASIRTEKILKEKIFQKEVSEQLQVKLVKRPKKKWFEKFRWFKSSDGFIIVGGKDASSNELLVKKHMEKNDLFFHTELRGAPAVLIKNPENIIINEQTFSETACFAASYSNAWREGWGSTKIFYVYPEQVTKSPNPGEFLKKGAFFIKVKKNFLTKPFMELAIGLILEPVGKIEGISDDLEDIDEKNTVFFPRIITGPPTSIKSKTNIYVRIHPQKSGKSGGKLAKEIKTILINSSTKSQEKWAKLISLNDIVHFLPPGDSVFAKKKKIKKLKN